MIPLSAKSRPWKRSTRGSPTPSSRPRPQNSRSGYQKGETLDDLLPEAFATCREAADRVLGHAPLPGAAHRRHRAPPGPHRRDEDRRGQDPGGHPARLPQRPVRAKGVHIVTVNDYLAKRDSDWMGKVYRFLGLTVGLIIHGVDHGSARRPPTPRTSPTAPTTSWASTTCGTTWPSTRQELVQRGHAFAIVDEVDSILIDEARTPLIISGQGEQSTQLYTLADNFAASLKGLVKASRGRQGRGGRRHRRRLHRR